jgi:hypothetical protein
MNKMSALLVICLLFVQGCTSVKPCPPCPPAEIITEEVPGPVVPCPTPPAIRSPEFWLPNLNASGATVAELLAAAEHDRAELERYAAALAKVVKAYASPPDNPAPR